MLNEKKRKPLQNRLTMIKFRILTLPRNEKGEFNPMTKATKKFETEVQQLLDS